MNTFKSTKWTVKCAGLSILPLAIAFAPVAAHAEDESNMFSVSGFGTIGATHSSSTDADYTGSLYQATGAGASNKWAFGVSSKLGLQVNARLTDQLSGLVQVIAQNQASGSFSPRVEWANLQYAFTPDLKVRAGRTVLPTFMVSETRYVGYSNPWILPPLETYNLNPLSNMDGIDATYKMRVGSVSNTVQVFYGKTSADFHNVDNTTVKGIEGKQIEGITYTMEYGSLTARAGLQRQNVSLGPVVSPARFYNLGATYDAGTWFLQGEITRSSVVPFVSVSKAAYITGGYRLNNFTPYATYSKVSSDNSPFQINYDQKTASVGVRWDFMKNTSLKLQLDRSSVGNKSNGYFTNVKPGIAGSSVNIINAAVDFVF